MSSLLPTPQPPPLVPLPAQLVVEATTTDANTLLLSPIGEADICSVPRLRHALRDAIAEGWARVVVDLDRLTFMDASTLGVLVDARRRLGAAGGTLQVRCQSEVHRKILSMTWLEGLLEPVE